MPGLLDWLFPASGALKKAAGTGDNTPAPAAPAASPAAAPVIDMAAEAAKMVPKPPPITPTPAVTPATPVKKKLPTAVKIGAQMQD